MENGPALKARDGASDDTSIAVLAVLNGHLGHFVEPKLLRLPSGEPQAHKLHSAPARVEHDTGGRGPPKPPQSAATDSQPNRDAEQSTAEQE
jgi:hypothetical protein